MSQTKWHKISEGTLRLAVVKKIRTAKTERRADHRHEMDEMPTEGAKCGNEGIGGGRGKTEGCSLEGARAELPGSAVEFE